MFASALKSFSSNISSNYTLSPSPVSTSGPWKIHDAKKKSTGKTVSVFIFERKSLDPHSGLGRSGTAAIKRAQDEVIERLKKEASSLARLRHPSVLELVEPVEDTRGGGLMFATEQVTASLTGLLEEKDVQERAGGTGGRISRYVVDDPETGGRRRKEVEIDELEIQKGLLQIGKGLEFLHESAGLVHGNLTPDAIYINAKSDWKLSGLGFSGPPENSTKPTSVAPISLSEVLHHDPRLPRSVQLNLDFTSPDFALDSNVTSSADLFSLGLLIVALYNSPHVSPLQVNSSLSSYKRLYASSDGIPSVSNDFGSSQRLPKDLTSSVLPRLITRRPAQRLTAREFQQTQYFDNILVSTIRFLDSIAAKTPNEKAQFMRGLSRVLSQFPKSVLEKKVLPALLEEMKDHELLSLILQNVFKIVTMMPSGRRAFTERVIPRLREVFIGAGPSSSTRGTSAERDTGKEAGLMMILENMSTITENCSGKDLKEQILPLVQLAIESTTHSIVDAALRSLPSILPALDFPTVKNDLFPAVAAVFTKTNSLGIKVRGLEAFNLLCGGSNEQSTSNDDLDGVMDSSQSKAKKNPSNPTLDKYTVQEKIVPLLKGIKTKEPAVMMAALDVFKQVGRIVDIDFIATDVLPALWGMSLGPLLNLQQFKTFMSLIQTLSNRVEQEQTRKLQELAPEQNNRSAKTDDFMSFGGIGNSNDINGNSGGPEDDFERLVSGKSGSGSGSGSTMTTPAENTWDTPFSSKPPLSDHTPRSNTPVFSWSTPDQSTGGSARNNISLSTMGILAPQPAPASRTITPDLTGFASLTPSSGGDSSVSSFQTLQPQPLMTPNTGLSTSPWTSSGPPSIPNPWVSQPGGTNAGFGGMNNSMSSISLGGTSSQTSYNPPAAPLSSSTAFGGPQPSSVTPGPFNAFSIRPPPAMSVINPLTRNHNGGPGGVSLSASTAVSQVPVQKAGLDKYESLL